MKSKSSFIQTFCIHLTMLVLLIITSSCRTITSGIRERYISSMTDQAKLAAIAVDPNELPRYQYLAIEGITEQWRLADIAESPCADTLPRLWATKKISTQEILARIAICDKDSSVRQEAILRLNDQKTLANIAISDVGKIYIFNKGESGHVIRPLACDAVARLNDQALLAKVAIESPPKATMKSVPRTTLGRSGLGGQIDAVMASGANVSIITPDGRTITNAPEWEDKIMSNFDVNEAAVAKLTDLSLLAKVKTESTESAVQECVDRRMEELSSREEVSKGDSPINQ